MTQRDTSSSAVSDTPRTVEAVKRFIARTYETACVCVDASDMAQLERELAEAQEANEELQVLVERFRKHSAPSASGGIVPAEAALQYIELFKNDQKAGRTLDWGWIALAEQALKEVAPSGAIAPVGMVLVPAQPTLEMMTAGTDVMDCASAGDSLACYRAMLAAAPSAPSGAGAVSGTSQWIPVSERLPEENTPVWVTGWAHNKKDTKRWRDTACLSHEGHEFGNWWGWDFGDESISGARYAPTHWQPLPAAPAATEEGKP